MNTITLSLILISVLLSVTAQILLKHGMSSSGIQEALGSDIVSAGSAIFTNISVLGGLTAYVLSAGFWLLVLSKVEVSKAYPFVGLGFIGTMLFAYFFLNEPLTLLKVLGTLFALTGVILISQ